MSFRILFADDSMTAQNMGKKILTDAGYEVVAVSNGAAAVKKIAEQKPDIIILDIYMPGYSGLEVCDKVRSSVETLKTPVLLTVGKMEPYRAEDANRVRADGVIIKPFEASDLLAVIKKLEERVVPKTIALAQDTVLLERPPEFEEFEPPRPGDAEVNGARSANTVPATVDVPDNMATTAAFSDMLGTDPAYSLDPLPVPQPASAAEPVIISEPPAPVSPKAEEFSTEAWTPSASSVQEQVPADAPVEFTPEPANVTPPAQEFAVETPVEAGTAVGELSSEDLDEEPKVTAASEEFSNPQLVSQEPHRFIDPGLAIDVVSFDQPPAEVQPEPAASEPQVVVSEAETSKASTVEEFKPADVVREATPTEDDFEARVAAAMSVYDTEEKVEAEPSPSAEPKAASEVVTEAAPTAADEPIPSFEYRPPVNTPATAGFTEPAKVSSARAQANAESMLITTEATMVIPVYLEPPVEPKHEEPVVDPQAQSTVHEETAQAEPQIEAAVAAVAAAAASHGARAPVQPAAPEETVQAVEQRVESHIEAAFPAVTAAVAANDIGADTQMITAVVDRILERLKPQMIEEIARELKKPRQ